MAPASRSGSQSTGGSMLERFTDAARRVVVLATEDARHRRHRAIEPEHLLLAILRDGGVLQTPAGRQFRAVLGRLETEVAAALDELPAAPAVTEPSFSDALRAVLEAAFQLPAGAGLAIGVDHLLYGLLTHGASPAGLLLRSADDRLEVALRLGFFGEDRARLSAERVRFIATSPWRVRL
jgi:ATP-dependent Clp protease ATP-binding subunit ClpC